MKNMKMQLFKFLFPIVFFEGLFFTLLVLLWHLFGLRINETNSFPIGIYQVDKKSAWQKDDLVLVCPPNTKQFKVNVPDTLAKSSECGTGTIPLFKKIKAVAGDTVVVADSVTINHVLQKNSNVFYFSGDKKLNPCLGTHKLKKGNVWLMSDYNKMSFDSRYFCEVPAANIIGKATLLVEF